MKALLEWTHLHPLKACAFTAFFTFTACLWDDCAPAFVLTLFGAGLLVWGLTFVVDCRRYGGKPTT